MNDVTDDLRAERSLYRRAAARWKELVRLYRKDEIRRVEDRITGDRWHVAVSRTAELTVENQRLQAEINELKNEIFRLENRAPTWAELDNLLDVNRSLREELENLRDRVPYENA